MADHALRLDIEDGKVTGKFGGPLFGDEIRGDFDGTRLDGRLGREVTTRPLTVTVSDDRVRGRLGGDVHGIDLDLHRREDVISGQVGSDLRGFALRCRWQQADDGDRGMLTGHFGKTHGARVKLTIEDIPPLLAVGVAAVLHYDAEHGSR